MRAVGIGRRIGAVALVVVAAQAIHCAPSEGEGEGEARCGGALPEVIAYGGDASDEAIERVWDKRCRAVEDAGRAPRLTHPAAGAAVPADEPAELRWDQAASAAAPAPRAPGREGGGIRLALGPSVARAHLPPVTGWVYLLELRPAEGGSIWIFTTETSFRPEPVLWRELRGRAGPIEVRALSAYLRQNVVDEGPYLSPSVHTFSIEGS